MKTTNDIRDAVVLDILEFATTLLPLAQRASTLPAFRSVNDDQPLSQLGIKHFQKRPLALLLEKRGRCQDLVRVMDDDDTCLRHWRTIEDVVTSVIAHPVPIRRSHHRRRS